MTTEEAHEVILAETEKEARTDMARIIRQIESEAREKATHAPINCRCHPKSRLRSGGRGNRQLLTFRTRK